MNSNIAILVLVICVTLGLLLIVPRCLGKKGHHMIPHVDSVKDIKNLFPASVSQINQLVDSTIQEAKKEITALLAVKPEDRTFKTIARALDTIAAGISVTGSLLGTIAFLSPDEAMRDAANNGQIKLSEFSVDWLGQNVELYQAFKAYAETVAPQEQLTKEQNYLISESLKDFKRSGLELPEEKREQIKQLQKELAALSIAFENNINTDNRTISVTHDELAGIPEDCINHLKRTADGLYILGVDTPTFTTVMKNCSVEETRKRLSRAYNNRAYPSNEQVLKDIVKKRDELAKVLGFSSYAALDTDGQMVQTPERAESFLHDLLARANTKEAQEFEKFKADLPAGVLLTDDGKFKSWDFTYVHNQYKKKHLDIDDEKIAEYFPMQHAVDQLLDIYQQFFNITLKEVPAPALWHPDVKLIEAYRKSGGFIGYLLLDLHPRDNKYSHACQIGIVPALKDAEGKTLPGVVVVIANFPKATATKPALLKYSDVNTFFHEFGHAIHSLLGATDLATQAGTNVKTDFVEMPSQMLEEWLYDHDILKKVSKHYKTGEPLPDDLIKKMVALKKFDSGNFVQRQGYFALLSLDLYKDGAIKDIYTLHKELQKKLRKHVQFDDETHFYTSFGHLTGYGAKYYGYLWSKVFALDLFDTIKKQGLLNPEIGAVYEAKILGRGGSADPNELLKDFLGREPKQDAFLRDMGF